LGLFGGDVVVELQRVGDGTEQRVHLDIDTDDVEAEVQRLEMLGARRLQDQDMRSDLGDPESGAGAAAAVSAVRLGGATLIWQIQLGDRPLALIVEIPLAVVCLWIAGRVEFRRQRRAELMSRIRPVR
jgi:hypothetical protein